MVKKNARNLFIALGLVLALTVLVQVIQPGGFSVIGSASNDMEQSPQDFTTDGCSVVDANSIRTAPVDLGAEQYFALTKDNSLVEIDGKVYACR